MSYYTFGYQESSIFTVKLPQGQSYYNYSYQIGVRAIDTFEGLHYVKLKDSVINELTYINASLDIQDSDRIILSGGNYQKTCQTIIKIATIYNNLNFYDNTLLSKHRNLRQSFK